ncbi:aminoacyl-tRNA hydrolase [Candidatus Gracilibacteria bacterium]|nr:aminoacyl-tRNA hydrolase [Candidatus Gracilibacteria bacterium]
MKLVIGLGNYGNEYKNTRHNAGFLFVDFFTKKYGFSDWKLESKFFAEVSSGNYQGQKTLFIKPQTYMNLSGKAVQKIIQFYKIPVEDIVIIYDDISMEFGKIRLRETGSAGGQNGVKDIIRVLGNDFKRIKIGIGKDEKYETSDWVLSKFREEELIELENEIFPKIIDILQEKI